MSTKKYADINSLTRFKQNMEQMIDNTGTYIGTTPPSANSGYNLYINPNDVVLRQDNIVKTSYNNSDDNTYSTKYINEINTYSTSEVDTGETWIDGKKVYKKTLQLEASTTTQSISVSSIANNIDKIWIDNSASFYGGTTGKCGVISDWDASGARYRIAIDGSNIYYVCSDASYKNGTITFKYTKAS